jgi:hypothetical protein
LRNPPELCELFSTVTHLSQQHDSCITDCSSSQTAKFLRPTFKKCIDKGLVGRNQAGLNLFDNVYVRMFHCAMFLFVHILDFLHSVFQQCEVCDAGSRIPNWGPPCRTKKSVVWCTVLEEASWKCNAVERQSKSRLIFQPIAQP